MEASVILVGDELVAGKIADTNGRWLAEKLLLQGIPTREIRMVKDNPQALAIALSQCNQHSSLVITTGGLGPTLDDRTKNILAEFFSAPLEEHPEARKMVQKHYQRRSRSVPPENTYHLIPKGFAPLSNPCGLAPGLFLEREGRITAALPGVPREMRMMAEQSLFPLLPKMASPNKLTIRTRGLTEEDIFLNVCPGLWEKMAAFGTVASLPTPTGIDLHVALSPGSPADELKALLKKSPIDKHIWQWGNLSLPALLLKEIKERGLTFSLAESATGGLASSLITDVPGASENFAGGVIAYNNAIKKDVLAVPEQYGPVSMDTARAMATGVQKLFNSDLAASVTGLAGPGEGTGVVIIGTAVKGGPVQAHQYHFKGNREQCKEKFALAALFDLRSRIGVSEG